MPTDREPDVLAWRTETGAAYLCGHCLEIHETQGSTSLLWAYRAAGAHCWARHSIRRLWVREQRPELSRAVQLAFDTAVLHNRTFD